MPHKSWPQKYQLYIKENLTKYYTNKTRFVSALKIANTMKCSRKKFKDVAYVMISWVSLNIICSINEKYNIISKKTCFKSEFFFISSRKYCHETIYGIISLYLLGTKKTSSK